MQTFGVTGIQSGWDQTRRRAVSRMSTYNAAASIVRRAVPEAVQHARYSASNHSASTKMFTIQVTMPSGLLKIASNRLPDESQETAFTPTPLVRSPP